MRVAQFFGCLCIYTFCAGLLDASSRALRCYNALLLLLRGDDDGGGGSSSFGIAAAPATYSLKLRANISRPRAVLPESNAELCGEMIALGRRQSGESSGRGSVAKTSR